ncbi:phosphatase PAP2 family protein [Mastigocoleus sp. MO_188.B34]|uniref:phosphatase PAP2 family protein n=1 Tax=Mastigocoleus sp. MO_188.B34 TaxID=3036635 RepID=UPI00261142F2|nr:phosphatase PAP2 family protein [Mastigocoleus sp. MO_188.B34]MDJ0695602.1 phosphatase PAP2 family protein [Mastigocoleus sp. MO_188.B34]
MLPFKALYPVLIALVVTTLAPKVKAETFDRDISEFVSGAGTLIYLGGGVTLPLLIDSQEGKQRALRTLDSLGSSTIVCIALKKVTRVQRPDSDSNDSFPSCHATAAFAVATVQSHYNPDSAFLWYSGATLISYSRLNLNRHRISEVLAGAALGYLTAKLELSQKRGLILFPFIHSNEDEQPIVGLQVMGSF